MARREVYKSGNPIPPNPLCPIIPFLQNKGGKETMVRCPRLEYGVLNSRKARKWFLVT